MKVGFKVQQVEKAYGIRSTTRWCLPSITFWNMTKNLSLMRFQREPIHVPTLIRAWVVHESRLIKSLFSSSLWTMHWPIRWALYTSDVGTKLICFATLFLNIFMKWKSILKFNKLKKVHGIRSRARWCLPSTMFWNMTKNLSLVKFKKEPIHVPTLIRAWASHESRLGKTLSSSSLSTMHWPIHWALVASDVGTKLVYFATSLLTIPMKWKSDLKFNKSKWFMGLEVHQDGVYLVLCFQTWQRTYL